MASGWERSGERSKAHPIQDSTERPRPPTVQVVASHYVTAILHLHPNHQNQNPILLQHRVLPWLPEASMQPAKNLVGWRAYGLLLEIGCNRISDSKSNSKLIAISINSPADALLLGCKVV